MPVVKSTYRAPWYLRSGHLQTVLPFWLDKPEPELYQTEILELKDGDFLELDWMRSNSSRLMVISHGLEGNSRSYYVKNLAKYFHGKGWDILAWNLRGCGRQMNRLPKSYFAGNTNDLQEVIGHGVESGYRKIVLIGVSIGAVMNLNYAGLKDVPSELKAVVSFSAPCDAMECTKAIDRWNSFPYRKKFLDKLKKKALKIEEIHPGTIDVENIHELSSFGEFNKTITAPLNGFERVDDFYEASSCCKALERVSVPTLLVNALDDPILGPMSFPYDIAKNNDQLSIETPQAGGHAGFLLSKNDGSWMERRTDEFLKGILFSRS